MESVIQNQLDQIEAEHAVRILYAAESGSRAWGFASADSDYDVRFVYVRGVTDYVRLNPPRDVIELPIQTIEGAELDVNGWDLFKALTLFRASNPPLLEWLHSPIIYREPGDFAGNLRELAQTSFSPKRMTYHYLSMAKKNFRDYIEGKDEVRLKKYLYVLRPLLCARWIEQQHTPAPTNLYDTLADITLADEIRTALVELIALKQASAEIGTGPGNPTLDSFIAPELARLAALAETLLDVKTEADPLNRLAWEILGLPAISP